LEKAAEHGAQRSVKIKTTWDSPDGYVLHGLVPAFDLALRLWVGLDLSRFCAAPLITYCEAKETSHEHRQDG
jgi:hypothetical protein